VRIQSLKKKEEKTRGFFEFFMCLKKLGYRYGGSGRLIKNTDPPDPEHCGETNRNR
jgi:hypothetical protein